MIGGDCCIDGVGSEYGFATVGDLDSSVDFIRSVHRAVVDASASFRSDPAVALAHPEFVGSSNCPPSSESPSAARDVAHVLTQVAVLMSALLTSSAKQALLLPIELPGRLAYRRDVDSLATVIGDCAGLFAIPCLHVVLCGPARRTVGILQRDANVKHAVSAFSALLDGWHLNIKS